jgi:ribosomal protein S18 acetylase RimI-like enzyme
MLKIKPLFLDRFGDVWPIIEAVVRGGATYTLPVDLTRDEALLIWSEPSRRLYAAVEDEQVLGTYYLRTNQPGPGSHVANAGYMTAPAARGRGLARAMCAHSLVEAQRLGYAAMQFNSVVSTNEPAVRLWSSMGFAVVGRVPGAFRLPDGREVDTLVMHRFLNEGGDGA